MDAFKFACFAVVVLAALAAFLVYPILPPTVPTHWNAAGIADGFGPSWIGAFLIPLIMSLVLLLFVVIPMVAVFEKNLKAFRKQYWMLGFVILVFFLLFYAISLLPNFGYCFNFSQIVGLPLAMLFISIGVLMPSFKRNFFVGIRTPWTLADDKIWKKTHKFGGKLFILAGLASLLSLPFPATTIGVVVASALVAGFGAMLYSLYIFKKKGGRNRL